MALAAVTPVPEEFEIRPAELAIEVAYAGAGLRGTADTGLERRCRCLGAKGARCETPPTLFPTARRPRAARVAPARHA